MREPQVPAKKKICFSPPPVYHPAARPAPGHGRQVLRGRPPAGYGRGMIAANSLTPAQAEKLRSRIDPMTRYVCRLRERLDSAGCPGDDPFRVAVERATDAMRALSTELHYCGCRAGVGRPPKA